jgi:hypothetical protein
MHCSWPWGSCSLRGQRDAFVGQPAVVCGDRSISVLEGVDAFSDRALLCGPGCAGATLLDLRPAWFVAEVAGNKLAGSLAAYSETIQAGVFYAIFVAIAMVSKVALLMATPVLKRLTAES